MVVLATIVSIKLLGGGLGGQSGAAQAPPMGAPQNLASQRFPTRMTLLWGETQVYVGGAAVAAIPDPDRTYIINPANLDQILTPFFQEPVTKRTLRVFAEGYFVTSNTLVSTLEQVTFIGRPFDDFTLGNPISTRVSSRGNLTMVPFDAPVELNPNEPISAVVTGAGASECVVGLVVSVATPLSRVVMAGDSIIEDPGIEGTGMIAWGFPGSPTWTSLPPPGLAQGGVVPPTVDQGSLRLVAPAVTVPYVWQQYDAVPAGFTLNDNTNGPAGAALIVPPNRRVAFKLAPPPDSGNLFLFAGLVLAPNQGITFSPWVYMGDDPTSGAQGPSSGRLNYSGWYGVFDSQNMPRIKVLSLTAVTPEMTARVLLL